MAEQEKQTQVAAAEAASGEATLPEVQPDEANLQASYLFRLVWGTVALIVIIVWMLVVAAQWQMQKRAEAAAASLRYPLREETEAHARQLLEGYGVVDAEEGIYRIPIDRAMEEVVKAYGGDSAWTLPRPSGVSTRM
ncbi:hypothetical protein [Rhodothermus profundi]|uniref:Uncharacterized protein n=1 Tax=Rhodothermus profundi TaxID=633813 RepID=A0A1M6TS92_9BACT|nr:hypothetical protein [Rhodothermus profundi]SHK59794.1 hypothetical protein SAMN04488087_1513 [Rhodothermus profundi]